MMSLSYEKCLKWIPACEPFTLHAASLGLIVICDFPVKMKLKQNKTKPEYWMTVDEKGSYPSVFGAKRMENELLC